MSPEQARGEMPTPQTDIYAIGVVLYEMLTGERPFTGELATISGSTGEKIRREQLNLNPLSPRRLNPQVGEELEELIIKCLQKEPAKRQKSVLELLSELTSILSPSNDVPEAQSRVAYQKSTNKEDDLQGQVARSSIMRAEALLEMGKLDQAIQELQQAYKIRPELVAEHLAVALRNRGELKIAQGKIEEAQNDYHQAASVAPKGALRDDLIDRINNLKVPVSNVHQCPTCGKPIEPNWVACPYCKSRLTLHLQQVAPVNVRATQLPAIWFGYVFILVLSALAVFQSISSHWGLNSSSFNASLMVILGIVAYIYWLVCLYQLHKVLQKLTDSAYPISSEKAVGFMFIPIYNYYWIFKWTNELINLIHDTTRIKLRKGGMGLLVLIGLLLVSIAYSLVTPSALAGLIFLAFGLLLIFSALEFFSNELKHRFGVDVQEKRSSLWAAQISQFVDKYGFILWMIVISSSLILASIPPGTSSADEVIWFYLATGIFQQMILQAKRPVFLWWAVFWTLGCASSLLALLPLAVVFVLRAPALSSTITSDPFVQNTFSIFFSMLMGAFSGLYQWLILRKSQVKGAGWWILVSAICGLAFIPVFTPDKNSYLITLSTLVYGVVTGLVLEWIFKRQTEPSQNLRTFMAGMPAWIKAVIATILIIILYSAYQTWNTRKIEDVTIQVPANAYWMSTNLNLSPGNKVIIRYVSGSWSIDPSNTEDGRYTDANGVQYSSPNKYCPTCDAPDPSGTLGMLYAHQNTSSSNTEIGNYNSFTVQQSSILSLMINDSYSALMDNAGSITVEIQVYNH